MTGRWMGPRSGPLSPRSMPLSSNPKPQASINTREMKCSITFLWTD